MARLLIDDSCQPLKTFLVIAVVGVACAFCLKASAETGGVAPVDAPVFTADDTHLNAEMNWRLGVLPDQEFKVKNPSVASTSRPNST
jgi:hypothetical protein